MCKMIRPCFLLVQKNNQKVSQRMISLWRKGHPRRPNRAVIRRSVGVSEKEQLPAQDREFYFDSLGGTALEPLSVQKLYLLPTSF